MKKNYCLANIVRCKEIEGDEALYKDLEGGKYYAETPESTFETVGSGIFKYSNDGSKDIYHNLQNRADYLPNQTRFLEKDAFYVDEKSVISLQKLLKDMKASKEEIKKYERMIDAFEQLEAIEDDITFYERRTRDADEMIKKLGGRK